MQDDAEGRRKLRELLPLLRFKPESDREILLRINRGAISGVEPGLFLNQISTWSIRRISLVQVSAMAGVLTQAPAGSATACMVELDFNTDAERTLGIPANKLAPLVSELIEHAETVISEGIAE